MSLLVCSRWRGQTCLYHQSFLPLLTKKGPVYFVIVECHTNWKTLSTIYGLTTSCQLWTTLANWCAPHSRSRITHLKRQLQTLNQDNQSCTANLLAAKSWSDQLVAISKAIDEDGLISYVVGGLSPSYQPFITFLNFATRDASIIFDDFQAKLLNYEQFIEAQNKTIQPKSGQIAFFTNKSKPQCNKKQCFPSRGKLINAQKPTQ